jgi:hypothetical protein
VAGDGAGRIGELAELAGRYFDRPAPTLVPPERFTDPSAATEGMEIYFPYFPSGHGSTTPMPARSASRPRR